MILNPQRNGLMENHGNSNTIHRFFQALSSYYDFLGRDKEAKILLVSPKYKTNRRTFFLNKEQEDNVYLSCKDGFQRLIISVFRETGMRRACLLNIKPKDIDFEKNMITVPYNYEGNKAKITLNLPITQGLSEMILEYVGENNIKPDDNIFIMRGKDGMPYSDQGRALYGMVKNIGKKAGIPQLTPHTLRHTFGTTYYDKTKDIVATKIALGHKSLQATEIYTHSLTDQKKKHNEIFGDKKKRKST